MKYKRPILSFVAILETVVYGAGLLLGLMFVFIAFFMQKDNSKIISEIVGAFTVASSAIAAILFIVIGIMLTAICLLLLFLSLGNFKRAKLSPELFKRKSFSLILQIIVQIVLSFYLLYQNLSTNKNADASIVIVSAFLIIMAILKIISLFQNKKLLISSAQNGVVLTNGEQIAITGTKNISEKENIEIEKSKIELEQKRMELENTKSKFCTYCGAKNNYNDSNCVNCGAKLSK